MKIFIGKYRDYWGSYQIADLLQYVGVSEGTCYRIGEWLSNTKLQTFLEWIDSKKKRKVEIKIHDYDIWSADHTLSLIILPMLKMIQEDKHGAPFVDDEDVPDELKSTNAPPKDNEWETDPLWFNRWDWVLGEMIWSFQEIIEDSWEEKFHSGVIDMDFVKCEGKGNLCELVDGPNNSFKFDAIGHKIYADRIQNGCRLFGKYFQNLWT